MKFKEAEIWQLILACKCYQTHTGSEHMWDQYQKLVERLETYMNQHASS